MSSRCLSSQQISHEMAAQTGHPGLQGSVVVMGTSIAARKRIVHINSVCYTDVMTTKNTCDHCSSGISRTTWTKTGTQRFCGDHAPERPAVAPPSNAEERWYALNDGWA